MTLVPEEIDVGIQIFFSWTTSLSSVLRWELLKLTGYMGSFYYVFPRSKILPICFCTTVISSTWIRGGHTYQELGLPWFKLLVQFNICNSIL